MLLEALFQYKTRFKDEEKFIRDFLTLLTYPRAFHRDHLPGHITGSAWIVDDTKKFVLLTHHAKLNKWLQPGGHADGEENVLNVALREAQEETGLKNFQLLQEEIFDIDIHPIPTRKDFPEHLHYDVRFLFQADRNERFSISEESHDLAWVPLDDIVERSQGNVSMMRMAEKVIGDRCYFELISKTPKAITTIQNL